MRIYELIRRKQDRKDFNIFSKFFSFFIKIYLIIKVNFNNNVKMLIKW